MIVQKKAKKVGDSDAVAPVQKRTKAFGPGASRAGDSLRVAVALGHVRVHHDCSCAETMKA